MVSDCPLLSDRLRPLCFSDFVVVVFGVVFLSFGFFMLILVRPNIGRGSCSGISAPKTPSKSHACSSCWMTASSLVLFPCSWRNARKRPQKGCLLAAAPQIDLGCGAPATNDAARTDGHLLPSSTRAAHSQGYSGAPTHVSKFHDGLVVGMDWLKHRHCASARPCSTCILPSPDLDNL